MTDVEHRYKPLEEGEPTTNPYPKGGWTCFHCGENFTNVGSARDHFGADPDSVPGCLLKVQFGPERGMQLALRKVEDGLNTILYYLNDEHWDISIKQPEAAAITKAWDKVHELLAIVQPWRTKDAKEENIGVGEDVHAGGAGRDQE